MDLALTGKKVLVTGSSRGIGFYIAKCFLDSGANVIINGRSLVNLIDASNLLSNVKFVQGDLTNENEAALVVQQAADLLHGLDILICNVGTGKSSSSDRDSLHEWRRMIDMNLMSTIYTVHHSKGYLTKSKGKIVCISSICGLEYIPGAPLPYLVAKSALNTYVKSISRTLGALDVNINAIAPGNILFPGSTWDAKLSDSPELVGKMLDSSVPLRRLGTVDEISSLALYLSSDLANFVTGAIWTIDGGQVRGF